MTFALVFGLVMGIAHYFSDQVVRGCGRVLGQVTSFAAGISVTYVFMQLFPEFVERAISVYHPAVFLSLLAGFSAFHIIEKYIYQHSSRKKVFRKLALEDTSISFVYHFVVGMLLAEMTSQSITAGTLFFFPVFLHTAVHTLPVDVTKSATMKIFLATATLWGVLVATYIRMPSPLLTTMLIGFVVGTLLFSVIRHSLPWGREGKPAYFLLGTLLYSMVIFLMWGEL